MLRDHPWLTIQELKMVVVRDYVGHQRSNQVGCMYTKSTISCLVVDYALSKN